MKFIIKLLLILGLSLLLGLLATRPAVAKAPQQQNEDYFSEDIIITNDAIQKPNIAIELQLPVMPPEKKSVRRAKSGRDYSKEANGDIQTRIREKVIERWGEEYWPAMHFILDHESGSDPYAVNPSSGACGIPQALPCSKLLNAIGSLSNIEGQLDWMINYVAKRYEDPIKAMNFWLAQKAKTGNGWY